MEHVLNIGINIDDKAIENAAINQCAKQIMQDIQSSVIDDYYGNSKSNYHRRLKEMVQENIDKFCEDNKDIIIEGAINQLVEKLSRTKAVKEKLGNL